MPGVAAPLLVESRERRAADARRRPRADRRHVVVVVRDPRLPPARARRRARAQLERVAHVMFGGLTHEPAIELARRLVELTPGAARARLLRRLGLGLGRGRDQDVPAGARARGARGCWAARRLPRRHLRRDVGVRPGRRHAPPVRGVLPGHLFAPRPPGGVDAALEPLYEDALRELFARHGDELAAAIVEPVVQGAGGMWFYSPAVPGAAARALRRATACCWSSTRSRPASGAAGRSSRPIAPASLPM